MQRYTCIFWSCCGAASSEGKTLSILVKKCYYNENSLCYLLLLSSPVLAGFLLPISRDAFTNSFSYGGDLAR